MALDRTQLREGGRRAQGPKRQEYPLISIITVVFNAKNELSDILKSTFAFDPGDFELIVIDGGSNDGTVELLHQWDDKIEYWLSEPDQGIFDAMNKAQAFTTGHFLYHLNAGDRLLAIPIEELELALLEGLDIATFRVTVDGTREFRPSCGAMLRLKNTIHHQGTFYRRETFLKYDLKYKMLADYDVNQRLALGGAKMKAFDRVVAWHASGGAGDNIDGYGEHSSILLKNYGWFFMILSVALSEWKGIKGRRKAALKRWLQTMKSSR